jgi:protein-disulfide isomerase
VNQKQLIYGVVGAALVALAVVAYFVIWGGDSGSDNVGGGKGPIAIAAGEHTLGNKNAPLQVVEYAAPVCPHCARFNAEVFPKFKAEYIDTGKVYYIFRVFPLHPADIAAEGIARCLPKDNYFQFIDLLFRNQSKWDPEYGIQDIHGGLVEMGRIAGMSADKVDACIADPKVQAEVQKAGEDAQNLYEIHGTPSFLFDGDLVRSGEFPWEELKAETDKRLAQKK